MDKMLPHLDALETTVYCHHWTTTPDYFVQQAALPFISPPEPFQIRQK
jgi:hypothetical protein